MFGLLDGIKVAAGAAIGALFMYAMAHLFMIPAAEKAARNGYVVIAEKAAAEAELARIKSDLAGARKVIDAYQVQLKNEQAEQEAKDVADVQARLKMSYQLRATGESCKFTPAYIDWLQRHR